MKAIKTPRPILQNFRGEDAANLFAYLRDPVAICFLSHKLDHMDTIIPEVEKRSVSDEYKPRRNLFISLLIRVPQQAR